MNLPAEGVNVHPVRIERQGLVAKLESFRKVSFLGSLLGL